jgi:hypothetical protein
MKPETKKRRRPRARGATIPFPRPVVVPPKSAPEPEPEPAKAPVKTPAAREEVIEHMILRRDTGDDHGEERKIPPYQWAKYGLEKIPVNETPHRATLGSAWRQLLRFISGPHGYTSTRQNVRAPRRWWPV